MKSSAAMGRSLVLIATCWLSLPSAAAPGAPRCEAPGKIGYLGLSTVFELESGQGRMRVTRVTPGSPADRAGFVAGDLVVAIDGRRLPYADRLELAFTARSRRPGEAHRYTVRRDDRTLNLQTELAEPTETWEAELQRGLQHQEMERRSEGLRRLERLSAQGPVDITFRRDRDCLVHAEVDGRPASLPLTLAAGLRVVPLLARLRTDDSLTLEAHVVGNTIRVEPVSLPTYLGKRDVTRAIQESVQRDQEHSH